MRLTFNKFAFGICLLYIPAIHYSCIKQVNLLTSDGEPKYERYNAVNYEFFSWMISS